MDSYIIHGVNLINLANLSTAVKNALYPAVLVRNNSIDLSQLDQKDI